MIRVPHVLISNLNLGKKVVKRLVVAHPANVQYIQYDPKKGQMDIKYANGDVVHYSDTDGENDVEKHFESLVYQFKDTKEDRI